MNERDRGGRRRVRGGRGNAELQDLAGRALEFWSEIGRLWLSAATRLAPAGGRAPRRTTRARHRDDDAPREEQGARDDEERDDDHEERDDDHDHQDARDDDREKHAREERDDRDDDREEGADRDDREDGDDHDDEHHARGDGDDRDDARRHERARHHERATTSPKRARAGQLSVTLEIAGPAQVEVTLDLRPGTSLDGLSVQSLHAIDDDQKPAIRGVVLDLVHGRPRLRIAILRDQPKGIYVGAILDQERGEARGTLRVKVPHEPEGDGGHPHRKEGSAS